MIKRKFKRTALSLVCLLLAVFTAIGCGKSGNLPEKPGTSGSETEQEGSFTLSDSVYAVVSAESNASKPITSALNLIREATKSILGSSVPISDDWYRDTPERHKTEILIGSTNRPESIAADAELTYYDYLYRVVSPETVVICGGSDETTVLAVRKFLSDCYGYESGLHPGTLRDIPVGTSYVYRHSYGLEQFTLCGKDIAEYAVVSPDSQQGRTAAKLLQKNIERICGKTLPLATVADFSGKNAILIGCSDASGAHLATGYNENNYIIRLNQTSDGNTLIIDTVNALKPAIEAFTAQFLDIAPKTGQFELNFATDSRVCCIRTDEMNGLVQAAVSNSRTLAQGVEYREILYRDINGAPIKAYAVEVDLKLADILNVTPDFGDQITNVTATTTEAMQTAAQKGYRVLAGINADFFRINADQSPYGLCIKNGEVLHEGNRPWFGITDSGKPVIGTYTQYTSAYSGKLNEAVGGSHIILQNGYFNDIGYQTEFGYTRHPRTAIGITESGKLILLVVDGRSTASNGASLGDLAQILLDLKVTDALNLDGGGSSTMATVAESGKYIINNTPSDGTPRQVFNSLVVVAKQS